MFIFYISCLLQFIDLLSCLRLKCDKPSSYALRLKHSIFYLILVTDCLIIVMTSGLVIFIYDSDIFFDLNQNLMKSEL